jgi:hypothetical protein
MSAEQFLVRSAPMIFWEQFLMNLRPIRKLRKCSASALAGERTAERGGSTPELFKAVAHEPSALSYRVAVKEQFIVAAGFSLRWRRLKSLCHLLTATWYQNQEKAWWHRCPHLCVGRRGRLPLHLLETFPDKNSKRCT